MPFSIDIKLLYTSDFVKYTLLPMLQSRYWHKKRKEVRIPRVFSIRCLVLGDSDIKYYNKQVRRSRTLKVQLFGAVISDQQTKCACSASKSQLASL